MCGRLLGSTPERGQRVFSKILSPFLALDLEQPFLVFRLCHLYTIEYGSQMASKYGQFSINSTYEAENPKLNKTLESSTRHSTSSHASASYLDKLPTDNHQRDIGAL